MHVRIAQQHHFDTHGGPLHPLHHIPISSAPSTPGTGSIPSTTEPSPSNRDASHLRRTHLDDAATAAAIAQGYFTPRRPQLPRTRTGAGTNASPGMRRALEGIRTFVASKSCYDILPESFRLIVFDTKLGITKSLQALVTNGVVSAPLYDSTTHRFAGMFTLADVVHLIQYYYLTAHKYENVIAEVEAFQLESLREIEQAIDVPPPPTISVHPDQPLADACAALVRTHARRLPLVDRDDQTGKETIISVLTQYRVLKFIAINCAHDCARLDMSIGALGIGSYASWYQPAEPLPAPQGSSTAPSSANPSAPSSAKPSSTMLASQGREGGEGAKDLSRSSSLSASIKTSESESAGDDVEEGAKEPREENGNGEGGNAPESSSSGGGASSSDSSRQSLFPPRSFSESQGGGETTPTGIGAASDQPALSASSTTTTATDFAASSSSSTANTAEPQLTDAGAAASLGVSDRFWPLSTATMQTSVFDVVHVFSERGISAVPIVDEDGVVLNLFETVDIVDLVRQNAYQVLDQTIEDALNQRSPDFTGVMTCTPADSLASILAYVRDRRCHRFVIVEPEDVPARDGMPARKKGSLVGLLSLSDVLRFIVGHENLKGMEVPGLGVHGLRGVQQPSAAGGGAGGVDAHAVDFDYDASSVTDASSSKATSRRNSEATTEASVSGSQIDLRLAQQTTAGLDNVIEGKAVE
ncbi:AMP-activated serine/threonine-protein kinase regulatory subunit [Rhodotorula mucilaginosa]|uniref:AMP-activated serine/threonine-protein kinase regulatory subunit n=1 Tax=Rhodotorula mucilaginosa TaxID=5537 RepID=A0A9P6VXQ0_RHOMI|nr:AMP-activated serine/threonine-protein kinase regulatory subunit [Rhodotorula mucilaginosa]TKA55696.1 hypothetical protein B0A53_02832 [Rhodotorula sp. CCFEE 5036]